MKVSNMTSYNGNKVANQFIITDESENAEYFQSYDTVIAKRCNSVITLDINAWNYSRTTAKYRNIFLNANTAQVEASIKSGEYLMRDLNNKTPEPEKVDFKRVNSDINGNPRYVCNFRELLTVAEASDYETYTVSEKYNIAIARARKIGGGKFNNKQYGGGIVFQSYSLDDTVRSIAEVTGRNLDGYNR